MIGSAIAALLQGVQGTGQGDTIHGPLSVDSIRMDQPPLPGGVARIFRFLFSGVPQWIQIAGVVVGAIVAVVVVTVAWKRRADIIAWLGARSHGYKVALGASVATVLLAAGLVGGWSYNYMMHENDFCSSCHVMRSAFGKFQTSEHSKLQCHACHQQSIFASMKELYYWVLERPDKIPSHSPVPDRICAECHITQQRDSVWKYISATAGHRVHLESDSSALKDVMCVTCHAKEVHAFAPTDLSCSQSGCHEKVKVTLGKMADQTSLHCTTCHEFARPVNETAPVDSSRKELVPFKPQCFACHEMREKLAEQGLDNDPHKARCGECHNPHKQTKAEGAIKSCATSTCHASADTLTAFHRGLGDHAIDDCTACHKAHSWKVESTNCIDCHKSIFEDRPLRRGRLRRTVTPQTPSPGASAKVPQSSRAASSASAPAAAAGTWPGPYMPHASVLPHAAAVPQGTAGRATMRAPGGPSAVGATLEGVDWWDAPPAADGGSEELERPASPAAGAPTSAIRSASSSLARQGVAPRTQAGALAPPQQGARRPSAAPFQHSRHRKLACSTCHSTDRSHGELIIRAPASCQGCHHASDERAGKCSACHTAGELAAPHAVPVTVKVSTRQRELTRTLTFEHTRHANLACSSCHADDAARSLVKDCTGCHVDHHSVQRDCTSCHASPRTEHTRWTHDGCAACHSDRTVAQLPPVRTLCLSCHPDQRTHYAAKECVVCHRVSWNEGRDRGGTR